MKKTFLFIFALCILVACSSAPKTDVTGDWKLVSYGDAASPISALPGIDTSIKFEKGQLSGNVGCNSFSGNYEMKDAAIIFESMMSTEMFCEETSPQEQGVLSVLSNTTNLKMNGNTLTITSADGASVVNLTRK